MIFSIRGGHGSGKTTAINLLRERFGIEKTFYGVAGPRYPEAFQLDCAQQLYVLGRFDNWSVLKSGKGSSNVVLALLEKYASLGHVVFEGVVYGVAYGEVGRWMEKFGKDSVCVFLSTSLEQCQKNVDIRRRFKGDKAVGEEKRRANVQRKFLENERVRRKVLAADILRVANTSSDEVSDLILKLIKEHECSPAPRKRAR